jgi:pimeloyl-ACP methyl ester carboxylesterase
MLKSSSADDVEPVSRTYVSQGLKLHYLDWGNEGAPVLILVHGTRDHARAWDWTARAMRDRWHVIVPDLRGHGDSQWSPDGAYLLAYFVLDLVELVDVLDHDKVSIAAHSFGGSVVSRLAGLLPDRIQKLCLIDGLGPTPDVFAHWVKEGGVARMRAWVKQRRDPRAVAPRRFATIDEGASRMKATNSKLTDAQARHLALHGLRQHPDGYGWKFDPMASMFAPEDFCLDATEFWRQITAPTLLVAGTENWIPNVSRTPDPEADGYAPHFREHRTARFEGAGHWVHHDQFDAFIAALRDFF